MKVSKALSFLILILLCHQSMHLYGQTTEELQEELGTSMGANQLSILNKLSTKYVDISIDTSFIYAYKSLTLAKNLQLDSFVLEAHLYLFQVFNHSGQADSSLVHAFFAKDLAEKSNEPSLLALSYKSIASSYGQLAMNEKKIEYCIKSIQIYKTLKDTFQLGAVHSNIARAYKKSGDYKIALEYAQQANDFFSSIQYKRGQGYVASIIAELYGDLGQKEKAFMYLEKAASVLDKNNSPYEHSDILMQLGYLHLNDSHLDSAQYYFSESLAISKKLDSPYERAKSHDSLGEVFLQKKERDSCYYHLNLAFQILLQLDNKHGLSYTLKNLGAYFELAENRDSTEYYYLKSLHLAKEINLPRVVEDVLLNLHQFYEKSNQDKKALKYYKLYVKHINKIKGVETQKAIAALETKYEIEKKELKIERLEFEAVAQTSKANTFKIGLIAAISFLGSIVFGLLYRRKNERKIFVLKQQMYEQEKKEMDNELSYKTKQLTAHALHMVQKNKVLQELKSGILTIAKNVESPNKKALRALIRRIDFNIQSDEDWDTFRLYFEQTNQNFYHNLSQINKDLTSNELKLCSLIKLNMNIKETASVLNLAPTSVKTARHRLRKKLKLEQGQDLTSFIRQVA